MAKVQILQSISGAHFTWSPGHIVDMPDAEAEKWADGERGVYAAEDAVVHQTYDPDAEVIAEVLVPEDLGSDPDLEPHGQLAPKPDAGQVPDPEDEEPKRNASKGAWLEYAISKKGAVEADIADLTRDELVEQFATPLDPDA